VQGVKGEAMSTAAVVTYAYDQIDQARAALKGVSKIDTSLGAISDSAKDV
jgi:hypothetical protein